MSIKAIRKELGLSQTDFARLFGVHQTAVSQWETGRTSPDTEMAIQIARGTGHSVDDVLDVHPRSYMKTCEKTIEITMPDDAMAGARIRRGDRIYIRKKDEYESGSLIGIHKAGENTVRYLYCVGEDRFLMDAGMPAGIVKMEKTDHILGLVSGFYANLER